MARTLAIDADKVVVVESDEASKFLQKLPSSSQPQEFPGFLRGFQLTVVQLVQTVQLGGQRSHASTTDSTCTDSRPPREQDREGTY